MPAALHADAPLVDLSTKSEVRMIVGERARLYDLSRSFMDSNADGSAIAGIVASRLPRVSLRRRHWISPLFLLHGLATTLRRATDSDWRLSDS